MLFTIKLYDFSKPLIQLFKRKELKYQENFECVCKVVLNTHLQSELYILQHSSKLYILIEY